MTMSYKTTKGTTITNTMQVADLAKKYICILCSYIYFKLLYILDDDGPSPSQKTAQFLVTLRTLERCFKLNDGTQVTHYMQYFNMHYHTYRNTFQFSTYTISVI